MTLKRNALTAFLFCSLSVLSASSQAGEIGAVDTVFKLLGPNHKIKVLSFEDPDVKGVHCFVSRSVTGGLSGMVGLAEDTSHFSIACRQTGPLEVMRPIDDDKEGTDVFTESRSILFKKMRVVRLYDKETKSFVYLTYSDRLIEGSPQNSISVVSPQEVIGGGSVKGSQFLPR